MLALARRAHIHAVINEVLDRLHQPHLFGLSVHHGQENHAEAFLHLRVLEKLVQDDLRFGAAFQLDNNPHAVAPRLIANIGDIVNDFVIHQLRNAFHNLGFVNLVGNFPHDNGFASLVQVFNGGLGAHHKFAASVRVCGFNSAAAVDVSARRKVRAFYNFQDLFERCGWSIDQQNRSFHDFRKIMWRNIRGHAHSDSV